MEVKKIVIITLICAMLCISAFSGFKILYAMQKYKKSEESYSTIVKRYTMPFYDKKENVPISVDFEKLKNTCDNAVGWIYSENTPINYPVVQGNNNEYYLYRLPDGTGDFAGSIFADFRNSSDFSDLNTILYGHNMKNGSMFGSLENYKSQEYYDAHPIIYLFTPNTNYKILLIGGYTVSAESEDIYFVSENIKDRNAMIKKALEKSTFKSGVRLNEEDRLITLSTCTYDFEDARYVVIGVLAELNKH